MKKDVFDIQEDIDANSKPKRCYWTVGDQANIDKFYPALEKSLHRFHPEAELLLYRGEEYVKKLNDPNFYPKSKMIIVKELFDAGYDEVCRSHEGGGSKAS